MSAKPSPNLDRPFPLSGAESARYGAIVTLENADGRRLVIHRTGKVRVVVAQACEIATRLDPSFRVICVSNPGTIYTDLQGARTATGNKYGLGGTQMVQLPEHKIVGGALRYMLHERLRGSTIDAWRDAPR